MADGEHTHGRPLTLDDVQMIIGRAMVDEEFRKALMKDRHKTLRQLHISVNTDQKAQELIDALVGALSDTDGASLQDTLQKLRDSYLASSDGVIRPHCA